MVVLFAGLFMYAACGGYVAWLTYKFIKMVDEDGDIEKLQERLPPKVIDTMAAIAGFAWPVTIFGIGCGWGGYKFYIHHRTKLGMMMDTLVEKSELDPVGKEEWRDWFSTNIKRVPRRKLELLSSVGWDNCGLDDKEMKRIISSELADRDLFDVKF